MQIKIQRCYNGERTGAVRTHRVTSKSGLDRVLRQYQHGNGWGVRIDTPHGPMDSSGFVQIAGRCAGIADLIEYGSNALGDETPRA